MTLMRDRLGWNESWSQKWSEAEALPTDLPGRIVKQFQNLYTVSLPSGEIIEDVLGEVRGKLRHRWESRDTFPVVGDWVVCSRDYDRVVIRDILPRSTKLSRKVAGENVQEQPIVANIDVGIVVMGLDQNFNPRRLERFIAVVRQSGAFAAVVLTKADICAEPAEYRAAAGASCGDTPLFLINSKSPADLSAVLQSLLDAGFGPGKTFVMLGSSGVGKSTIANALSGSDLMKVGEVRNIDSKGRHTTTNRELLVLPTGALLIDTPGMRELQLWDDDIVQDSFDDFKALAEECRFRDCRHNAEPGCAIRGALEAGAVDAARLEGFFKRRGEQERMALRQNRQMSIGVRNETKRAEKEVKRLSAVKKRSNKWKSGKE